MEGNQQKMREALLEIAKVADDWERHSNTKAGALDRIYELANAALSEPPRQCDVGTPDEQERRYKATGEVYHTLTLANALAWTQTPYEAKEGATDGE